MVEYRARKTKANSSNHGDPMRALYLGPERKEGVEWLPVLELIPIKGSSVTFLKKTKEKRCAIAFTSPRGVRFLLEDSKETGTFDEILKILKEREVYAVGPRTARELERYGIKAKIPKVYTTEQLAKEVKGCVIAVRSEKRSDAMKRILGDRYDEVIVYRAMRKNLDKLKEKLKEVDVILISSAEIAKALLEAAGRVDKEIICIGPEACKPLKEAGLRVREAKVQTFEGLLEELSRLSRPSP